MMISPGPTDRPQRRGVSDAHTSKERSGRRVQNGRARSNRRGKRTGPRIVWGKKTHLGRRSGRCGRRRASCCGGDWSGCGDSAWGEHGTRKPTSAIDRLKTRCWSPTKKTLPRSTLARKVCRLRAKFCGRPGGRRYGVQTAENAACRPPTPPPPAPRAGRRASVASPDIGAGGGCAHADGDAEGGAVLLVLRQHPAQALGLVTVACFAQLRPVPPAHTRPRRFRAEAERSLGTVQSTGGAERLAFSDASACWLCLRVELINQLGGGPLAALPSVRRVHTRVCNNSDTLRISETDTATNRESITRDSHVSCMK